jgi:hypothetical protein
MIPSQQSILDVGCNVKQAAKKSARWMIAASRQEAQ